MNFIKKWILTKLGFLCPKCGGELFHRSPCSHGYGYVICKKHKIFNMSNTCDYQYYYKGPSISAISFPSKNKCPCCGKQLTKFIVNGKETEYCTKECGYITDEKYV